jgi:hypothetical protein
MLMFGIPLGFLFYLFFKPIPNVNLVRLPPYMVADLICPIRRTWNFLLLQDLFDPLMVQNIITIHLPVCGSFDKWVWAPSPSGNFSVKSAHDISVIGGQISSSRYRNLDFPLRVKNSS